MFWNLLGASELNSNLRVGHLFRIRVVLLSVSLSFPLEESREGAENAGSHRRAIPVQWTLVPHNDFPFLCNLDEFAHTF